MKTTITLLVTLFVTTQLHASQNILSVVYEPDTNSGYSEQLERLKQEDALPVIVDFINQSVRFAQPVTLLIGAEDGPLFDPATNEIWVPGSFLIEIEDRFSSAGLATTEDEQSNAMLDVLMHTLLHEVAHVIIAQYDIPTLGKEEDAADNLANVLLLEYANQGDTIALNAADMFALEDRGVESLQEDDFWDEHSLDIQRYYTTLCHVYGANPEDNDELIDNGELSADKAERCIDEYYQVSSDWLSVLEELNSLQPSEQ